jgi:hypothetical protein
MYNKPDVVQILTALANGTHLSADKYDKIRGGGSPCSATVVSMFGSWREALTAANVPHPSQASGRRLGDTLFREEDLIASMRMWHEETGKTSVRIYDSWRSTQKRSRSRSNKDLGHPSSALIRIRFGLWSSALKAAGL